MNNKQLKLIKRAFFEVEMLELDRIEHTERVVSTSAKNFINNISILKQQQSKSCPQLSFRKKISIFIATILIFALALTACTFREELGDLFVDIYNRFAKVKVNGTSDNSVFEHMKPSYLPEGYILIYSKVADYYSRTIWSNQKHKIYLDQDKIDTNRLIIDTELSNLNKLEIENITILYVDKNNTFSFFWVFENYQFTLTCPDDIGIESVKKIIKSIAD